MSKKISIVVKRPQEQPERIEVVDSLKTWQELVGGYIEVVPFTEDSKILIICNEEGKLTGLKPNMPYGNDILVGTIVFVGNDAPNFRSLTEDEKWFVLFMATKLSF